MAGTANYGPGVLDVGFTAGAGMKTSTAQYKTVFINTEGGCDLATASNITVGSRTAIGVNQTMMSSGSTRCTVRLLGISKAICRDSVTAGVPVVGYDGVSTSSGLGCIAHIPNGKAITTTSHTVTAWGKLLGTALTHGQTGESIAILLNPQFVDQQHVGWTTAAT